jgi:hypothetical protein
VVPLLREEETETGWRVVRPVQKEVAKDLEKGSRGNGKGAAMKVTDLYVEYATEVTDAPRLYAEWLAYLVVSCVLNKSVWMDYGGFMKMFPNLYLLIIGPSSVYRKSFSQRLAASIVREIYDEFQLLDVSSRETFISEMARDDRQPNACGLMLIDEMAGFMARVKTSPHFSGMIQDLSSAFTSDTIERRVGVSEEEKMIYRVTEPFLNITAACSYDWLTKSVETSDLTGGFLARFLWIVPPEKGAGHWSEAKQGDALKRSLIIEKLQTIRSLVGKITWSAGAKAFWDWWYSDFRERNKGGRWDANFERMTNQVRKVAMINAAQDLRLEISQADLEEAVAMAEPLVEHLNEVAIGENPEEILRQRILQYMRRRTPHAVTKSDLLNNVSGTDKRRLEGAMETLMEAEKVALDPGENGHHVGRRATKYRLREALRVVSGAV